MKIRVFGFVAAAFLVLGSSRGANNEYYTKPEVKRIVDALIKAYGGEEKLTGLDRVKEVVEAKEGVMVTKFAMYESRTKVRVDMPFGRLNVITYYDGKSFVSVLNGRVAPSTPQPVKDQLDEEIRNGVFQAEVVNTFKNKANEVLYRGKRKYDGKEYDVIETTTEKGLKTEHFIDPETHRRMVQFKNDEKGARTMVTVAFGEFEGVLYEKQVVIKGADGSEQSSLRVLEVSKDFNDSVFVPPGGGARNAI